VVMRCLEKLPDDRFSSMDELLGALVGLGLYAPQRAAEVSSPHKRSLRRGAYEDRGARYSSAGSSGGTDAGPDEAAEGAQFARAHARELARKRRANRRWKLLGAVAAVIAVVVAIILLVTLTGGGAPNVVGLTLDEASALAERAGMKVEVTGQIPSFDIQAGIVREQDPAPEGEAEDDVLRLTVTKEPTPVAVSHLQAADPEGDAVENDNLLHNLIDGDESTVWTTELYRSSTFGSIDKTGVGIDFVLEEEATIIEIVSSVQGWTGQLQQTTSSGGAAKLASLNGNLTQILTLGQPISRGRLWFTELAQLTPERWGVELSEIRFWR
jgi:beta-lactam-binding protein with PASTA domain